MFRQTQLQSSSGLKTDNLFSNAMLTLWRLVAFVVCLEATVGAVSRGSPWPMPTKISTTADTLTLDRNSFCFRATGVWCDILDEAFLRYFRIVFHDLPLMQKTLKFRSQAKLTSLDVRVQNPCDRHVYPSMGMDESCKQQANMIHKLKLKWRLSFTVLTEIIIIN